MPNVRGAHAQTACRSYLPHRASPAQCCLEPPAPPEEAVMQRCCQDSCAAAHACSRKSTALQFENNTVPAPCSPGASVPVHNCMHPANALRTWVSCSCSLFTGSVSGRCGPDAAGSVSMAVAVGLTWTGVSVISPVPPVPPLSPLLRTPRPAGEPSASSLAGPALWQTGNQHCQAPETRGIAISIFGLAWCIKGRVRH